MLRKLIEAGMDVARLNFSHGDYSWYRQTIENLRRAAQEQDKPIALMQDLQGIKIRTGKLENGVAVDLMARQHITITNEPLVGNKGRVSTSYLFLPKDVVPGDRILLSDGLIELAVLATSHSDVECEVVSGGTLGENQGINLPGVKVSATALTPKDLEDLDFGIEQGVDYVALSFIRQPQDLLQLKDRIAEKNRDTPVVAKLEKPIAIENLEAILEVCDGVMVARGDLGVEMAPEEVPLIQKHIIESANRAGKIVITATQMLESMIHQRRPTRAEASDVANAVFDGTDALMLSAETAVGRYPVQSVEMMSRIILAAEKKGADSAGRAPADDEYTSFPEAVCDAAYHASRSLKARAIVAFTQSGSTARMISRYRPPDDILGVTPHPHMVNRMKLLWGVKPLLMREIRNMDELIEELDKLLLARNLAQPGDTLIILTGAPILERGHTSLMKLHMVKAQPSQPDPDHP